MLISVATLILLIYVLLLAPFHQRRRRMLKLLCPHLAHLTPLAIVHFFDLLGIEVAYFY